ncbi:MAG TPA: hybrid sensor histidine kinase/response regulator [Anaerolineae bacterium]|nr:hybrid sensor histidine kinase/response regulator [Anaerolineae bacterium]
MGLSEQIRQQLINSFKAEQAEHVEKITQGLLALEKEPPAATQQELLADIFREAHSLKGSARAVNMTTIEALGHRLEDLLLQAKDGHLTLTPDLFDLCYQTLDAVGLVIAELDKGVSAPPTPVLLLLAKLDETIAELDSATANAESAPDPITTTNDNASAIPTTDDQPLITPPAADADVDPLPTPTLPTTDNETIRVSISKLDDLMAQFSELLATKIRAEQRHTDIRNIQQLTETWQKSWLTIRPQYNRLTRQADQNGQNQEFQAILDFLQSSQQNLRHMVSLSNLMSRQVANDNLHLKLIIDDLQESIKRVRMLPLSTITVTFDRMVRDLARQQNKTIHLMIEGGDTELDKRVLEQIKDPIMHLLRNAVDHGIETPEQRLANNKPEVGTIVLSASQQGNNIVIAVRDDGQGLDLDAIRKTAVKRRLLSPEDAKNLNDHDAAMLIFNSGLSTSKLITDISGRGVGLDVVRQNVSELHGILQVKTHPGQGTTLLMTIPLTMASSRGLLVGAGDQQYALPLTTVQRMLQIDRTEVAYVQGQPAITYQGQTIPLAWLADLLDLPSPAAQQIITIVIVAVADKQLGLVVDELYGEQEIVIKNLGKQLIKVGGIAGATMLGSGEVRLVLHTADLVKLADRTQSRPLEIASKPQAAKKQKTKILVVDDSITTRTLEKNILEAAGYQVRLATDGEEAFGTLTSGDLPSLIVSDVNMPRLDGIGLTQRVKRDARYQDIPVILVTSLDSPADKARGIEVGADAYIVKSHFDQGNLLETIAQLI